ncbi:HYR domain-containing protein [Paraflavisolibacter sp. H34]|uniref:HYR domain-containing protein n=1 Tax=Huijunlia imazamoxiresistens TaxID=3127457 RepID=UPI003018D0F3
MKRLLLFTFSAACAFSLQAQECTLHCPANIVVAADSGQGGATVRFPAATASASCGAVTYTPASGSFFRLGSATVMTTVASGKKCSFTVTVTDNEPPVLSRLQLSQLRLWPSDNSMHDVEVGYTATDNSGEAACTLSVTSNDPGSGGWQVLSNRLVRLQALRLTGNKPRIYIIKVNCRDASGNSSTRTTSIAVSETIQMKETRTDSVK